MNKKGKTDNSPKKKKKRQLQSLWRFFKKASGGVYIFFYQKRAKFVIVFTKNQYVLKGKMEDLD